MIPCRATDRVAALHRTDDPQQWVVHASGCRVARSVETGHRNRSTLELRASFRGRRVLRVDTGRHLVLGFKSQGDGSLVVWC